MRERLHLLIAWGMMLGMSAAAIGDSDGSYTGASLAWTSTEPNMVKARELIAAGRLSEAESLAAGSGSVAGREMLEIIRRLRIEYGLDEGAFLDKLRRWIPDAGPADLARWRASGEIQHRVLDGKVFYFRREPANLWRFCPEARRRRDEQAGVKTTEQPGFVLTRHLAEVIAAAERSGQRAVKPVRHRIHYAISVPPARLKAAALLRVWMPFPQEHARQQDIRLVAAEGGRPVIAPAGAAHRSVYFEQSVADPSRPATFKVSFEYTSLADYPLLEDARAQPLGEGFDRSYLVERLPHIAFTPEIRTAVAAVVGDEKNPLARARRIFEFVNYNIAYCAEEEYAVIPGFAEKCLRTRRGDCGIQATLFITMCRIAGIPARWQSGFETKPGDWNMHDWAEFYVEPWGWLAADPSYGLQKSEDPKVRYFYFGHQDSYRLIVNTDYGAPLHPAKQSLRSEPADFQRGEVELDGRNLYFDEWDWEMRFEW